MKSLATENMKAENNNHCFAASRKKILENHSPNFCQCASNSQDMEHFDQRYNQYYTTYLDTRLECQCSSEVTELVVNENHAIQSYQSNLQQCHTQELQNTYRCLKEVTFINSNLCENSHCIAKEKRCHISYRRYEDMTFPSNCCHDNHEGVACNTHRTCSRLFGDSCDAKLGNNKTQTYQNWLSWESLFSVISCICMLLRLSQNPLSSVSKSSHPSTLFSSKWCLPAIMCLFLLCTNPVSAQSWANPPEDSSAVKGSSVTLQCGVRDLGDRSIQWIQYLGEDTKLLFLDGEQFSDDVPERYSVLPHTGGGSDVSGYDLTLSNLVEEDDKVYECAVQRMGEIQAQVTVLVAPGSPLLVINDISDLTEGDLATLTCSTSGGNPQPELTWYRGGVEITGAQVTPPSDKFGTTESLLTRTLTRDDHLMEYKCSAENQANSGNPVTVTQTLAVKYAPVLDLGLYNPLRVVESSQVTLSCTVDAYPMVTVQDVQWLDGSGISLGAGFEHTIEGVSKSHSGLYSCRAENVVDVTISDLELDVQYGPKVTIHHSRGDMFNSELSINEGTPLNLTCVVDANPNVDLNSILWKRDDIGIHTGSYYYRSQISRQDTGLYSCSGSNTLSPSVGATEPRTGSDSVQLTVHYEPGRATIAIPPETIKNQRIELACSVDDTGFPEATLEWTVLGSSTILHVGPVLTLESLKLSDTNDYICTPTNQVGDGESATQRLDVLELPEWITSLPLQTESLMNNTALSIQCSVRGQPRPQVTWFVNDEPASLSPDYFTVVEYKKSIDVYSWNVTSVLQWKGYKRSPLETSLFPGDSGMYRCHVTSDIATSPLSSTTELILFYPPVVTTTSDKVAADAFGSATLECRAHSLPAAVFVWFNGTERVQSGGRVQITEVEVGGEFPFETSLTISNIQPHDFSTYTCQAENTLGVTEKPISLTVKTVPDPPFNLEIHSKTWESVELSWQPGFNGGYTQAFVISYMSVTEKPGHVTVEGATRVNVTMLYPSANYSFQVQGQNQLGEGKMSVAVATETNFFSIDPPTSIEFNPNTYSVTFDSPSTYYCARVDINDGNRWSNYVQCAPTDGGVVQISELETVDNIRVALCLETRQDICSEPEEAIFLEAEEDLPTYVVIIIGVVCAVIVIVLTLVLVCLCIRHNRTSKEEEDKEASNQRQPVKPLGNGHAKLNSSTDSPSIDGRRGNNPGYQGDDRSHGNRSPVFTTDSSQGAFFGDDYHKQRQPTGIPNGGSTQYHYDNQANMQREHSFKTSGNRDTMDGGPYGVPPKPPRSVPDKAYLYEDNHNTTKDSHNSGEGSVSSDSKPPKKVMYEVVV